MLEKGKRYLVTENLYNVDISTTFENGLPMEAFSGENFSSCLTQANLLQVIRNLTNKLTDVPNKLEKRSEIEIIEVEYHDDKSIHHQENKVSYIEFRVFFKMRLDDKEFQTYQTPFAWNYIREELLVEIK